MQALSAHQMFSHFILTYNLSDSPTSLKCSYHIEPQKMFMFYIILQIIANYTMFLAAAAGFGRNMMFVKGARGEYNI